ncbi:MAG: hypothetical protein U0Q08_07010 [Dermatophilaceae bacterium]|jgi:uncharacterized protein (DUF2235 family)
MWDPEHFPGADNVPWQLLIRARFAHEIDAVIASTIVRQVGARLSDKQAVHLARAAQVHTQRAETNAEQKVSVLSLLAEWDGEICPVGWPFRWPPKKRGFEELDDPITVIGLQRSLELLQHASPDLQKQLGGAIGEIGGFAR